MSRSSAADAINALIQVTDPSSLTAGQCNKVLNALEWLRTDAPDIHRRLTAVEPFKAAVTAQTERLFWASSGHVAGQLDMEGTELTLT